MNRITQQKIVDATNRILEQHLESSKDYFDSLPSFGGAISDVSSSTAIQSLLVHRFAGKFERPDDTRTSELKRKCYADWIAYERDTGGQYDFRQRFRSSTCADRANFYFAQSLVRKWTRCFAVDFTRVDITPGETFLSLKGATSVYQKLSSKDSWTVTLPALDDFITMILSNQGLRRCAKALLPRLSRRDYKDLWDSFSGFSNPADRLLAYRMEMELITVVPGSRASSVYKNREKRRFINIEPFGNVLLQRMVGLQLRDILDQVGNSLLTGQQDHGSMIANPRFATIDLKNASDSNWLSFLEVILQDTPLLQYVKKYRSPLVCFTDDDPHSFVKPFKVSSMGNGFTFEVMTLVLLAMSRTVDPFSRVYGDDIVISNRVVPEYKRQLDLAGFQINTDKTFVSSKFRESCGSFYHDDFGYLTSFDFNWCENIVDVMVTLNKINAIMQAHPVEGSLVFGNLSSLISSLIPSLCKGSGSYSRNWDAGQKSVHQFPGYIISENGLRRKRGNKKLRALYNHVRAYFSDLTDAYQLLSSDIDIVLSFSLVAQSVTKFEKERVRRYHPVTSSDFVGPLPLRGVTFDRKFTVPRDVFQIYHWLYAGRISKDTRRFDTFVRLDLHVISRGVSIMSFDLNTLPVEVRTLVAQCCEVNPTVTE